jgi:DNA transformation protein
MAASGLVAHCLELLSTQGAARTRRMFGGHGFYVDELFVALLAGDRLYLKTDATTRERFEAAGCEPFTYEAKGRHTALGYWSAPPQAMESPALMAPWARLALQAALAARTVKPRSAPKARRASAVRRR